MRLCRLCKLCRFDPLWMLLNSETQEQSSVSAEHHHYREVTRNDSFCSEQVAPSLSDRLWQSPQACGTVLFWAKLAASFRTTLVAAIIVPFVHHRDWILTPRPTVGHTDFLSAFAGSGTQRAKNEPRPTKQVASALPSLADRAARGWQGRQPGWDERKCGPV